MVMLLEPRSNYIFGGLNLENFCLAELGKILSAIAHDIANPISLLQSGADLAESAEGHSFAVSDLLRGACDDQLQALGGLRTLAGMEAEPKLICHQHIIDSCVSSMDSSVAKLQLSGSFKSLVGIEAVSRAWFGLIAGLYGLFDSQIMILDRDKIIELTLKYSGHDGEELTSDVEAFLLESSSENISRRVFLALGVPKFILVNYCGLSLTAEFLKGLFVVRVVF